MSKFRQYTQYKLKFKCISLVMCIKIRPTSYTNEVIKKYQFGFRRNRFTTEQIFAIRKALEKHWELNKLVHLLLVNFSKNKILHYGAKCKKLVTAPEGRHGRPTGSAGSGRKNKIFFTFIKFQNFLISFGGTFKINQFFTQFLIVSEAGKINFVSRLRWLPGFGSS